MEGPNLLPTSITLEVVEDKPGDDCPLLGRHWLVQRWNGSRSSLDHDIYGLKHGLLCAEFLGDLGRRLGLW